MQINFLTPRYLKMNEELTFNLGSDFSDINQVPERYRISLKRLSLNEDIEITWSYKNGFINVIPIPKSVFV